MIAQHGNMYKYVCTRIIGNAYTEMGWRVNIIIRHRCDDDKEKGEN